MGALRFIEGGQGGASEVTRAWQGFTVVCIATGPSLTQEQVERTRARICSEGRQVAVIVVNDAFRMAPWADLHYFADRKWHEWHKDKPEFQAFAGQRCTIAEGGWRTPKNTLVLPAGLHSLAMAGGVGLSRDARSVVTGSNSGHQALNIAALAGAARVLLLGYDGRADQAGRKHWFGDHPDNSAPPYATQLMQIKTVPPVAAQMGVRIINCTPDSAIDCFETGDITEFLN